MREIQNNPIQGALRRAKKEETERIRWEKEMRSTLLWKQFEEVGLLWFGTKIDKSTGRLYEYNRIPIQQKEEQWTKALTNLKNRPSEQRIGLLKALASGMKLAEDNTDPAVGAKYRKFFRFAPLSYTGDNPLRVSFTSPSRFFIEAVGDMSGHSREQQEKFREFMVRDAGLKLKVGLP